MLKDSTDAKKNVIMLSQKTLEGLQITARYM